MIGREAPTCPLASVFELLPLLSLRGLGIVVPEIDAPILGASGPNMWGHVALNELVQVRKTPLIGETKGS